MKETEVKSEAQIDKKYKEYIKETKGESRLIIGLVVIFLSIFFIVLWLGVGKGKFGETGDLIGGLLNPIVSLFAFGALLLSLKYTRAALQISSIELYETKEELAKSRKSHEEISRLNNKSYSLQKRNSKINFLVKTIENSKRSLEELMASRPYSQDTNFHQIIYSSIEKEAILVRFDEKRCKKSGDHILMQQYGKKAATFLGLLVILTKLDRGHPAVIYCYQDTSSDILRYLLYYDEVIKLEDSLKEEESGVVLYSVGSGSHIKSIKESLTELENYFDSFSKGRNI